jgi:hypothetical protein
MTLEVKQLKSQLSNLLNWNEARIDFLSRLLIALVKVKTVNLAELARAFISKAEENSRYRRIQRFLKNYELNKEQRARMTMQLMTGWERKILILDRTQWYFGKQVINVIVLAVQYGEVAVPLLWRVMDRPGNSETQMRIELIETYVELFSRHSIAYVTGDREFIGIEWLGYLHEQSIDFRLRIKKNTVITHNGNLINIKDQLKAVSQKSPLYLTNCEVYGQPVNLTAMTLNRGEYLLIIGNGNPKQFLKEYRNRWKIEELFACLKSRGFNFEDTHLTDPQKISKIMAILTLAFLWAVQTGQWLHRLKPIPQKKTLQRPIKSIFRYGLDKLQDVLLNIHHGIENLRFWKFALNFLSCT